jgi:adenosylhomocysteinase
MDVSFALQALSIEELLARRGTLDPGVHPVGDRVDREVGRLKLDALGVRIDAPTEAQSDYTRVWA